MLELLLALPFLMAVWVLLARNVSRRTTAWLAGTAPLAGLAILGMLTPAVLDGAVPQVFGTSHHMGTTRMADDPREGVVDRHCKVHGIDNLHIAGSSVFPTGSWAFPTFTIIALSLRLAEQLRTRLEQAAPLLGV